MISNNAKQFHYDHASFNDLAILNSFTMISSNAKQIHYDQ